MCKVRKKIRNREEKKKREKGESRFKALILEGFLILVLILIRSTYMMCPGVTGDILLFF